MRTLYIIPIVAGLMAIPATTASADDRALTGAALGATAGVVIAGPVGAAVGGVAGAILGGPPLPHVAPAYGVDRRYAYDRECFDIDGRRVVCPPVRHY